MLLLCMSVSGTIPLVICMILWWKHRNSFSGEPEKMLLLMGIGFFLIPFQALKFLLPTDIVDQMGNHLYADYFADFQNTVTIPVGDKYVWLPALWAVLLGLWILVIVCFSIFQVSVYMFRIRRLYKHSREEIIFLPGLGERRIRVSREVSLPYTAGFLKPYLVFPESMLSEKSMEQIYRHEYSHLKNRDSLIKLLCLIIICIHWFNPVAILQLLAYCRLSEYIADRYAVADCSKEEKKEYVRMMIALSAKTDRMPAIWKNNFLGDKKIIKRRMEYVMKRETSKKMKKSVAVAAGALTMMMSFTTIFAYAPMQISSGVATERLMEEDGFAEYTDSNAFDYIDFAVSDLVFVSDNNEISYILEESNETKAICIHDFSSGNLNHHVANSSGGCTVYVYNARKCKKCNYLEINELINTISYKKCIH